MNRKRISHWGAAWATALIATGVWIAPAQKQGVGASPQEMLDFLAKPFPAGSRLSLPDSYPRRFADWTEAQRKSGFQLMVQRCGLVNALEHDNPHSRMVPERMTNLEEGELAGSVCLPAHLPEDWPERRKWLENAQRLIAEANSYGGSLHLPTNLDEKSPK